MAEVDIFKTYLTQRFPNIGDIVKSFKSCSEDDANKRYLVDDQTKCIDFDILSKWIYPSGNVKQSADSLALSNKRAYLIEFKAGDQTKGQYKYKKLISGVAGKISDSDCTLVSLFSEAYNGSSVSFPEQEFCLVVDSVSMGIDALGQVLAQLSTRNNSAPNKTILSIIPDIMSCVDHPNRYSKVDVWYSEIFSAYVALNGITDF